MPHGESGHTPMQYWYNVTTGKVETEDNRSRAQHLLGPFDSQAEAEQALERVKERNEAWEADEW